MGEILDALRRADEERERTPRVVRRESAPSFPPLPLRDSEAAFSADATEPRFEGAPARAARSGPVQTSRPVAISRDKTDGWTARAVLMEGSAGPVAEAYRHFAVAVRSRLAERGARSLVVTSALRAEGKTTTSCNLALAYASIAGGGRVALVDLDLRRPAVGLVLGVAPTTGIESVLGGAASLDAARLATDVESLDLYLPAGSTRHAHGILSGAALAAAVRDLERTYDIVIIDSPPSLLVPDAALILAHAGAYIAVVRTGVTRLAALRALLKRLPREKFLGSFLTEAPPTRHLADYGYYHRAEEDEGEGRKRRTPWKKQMK
ncbi:MAG TPA: CpsD/CapB family tyrosine-protein kinase [Myxococcota bacterium]|nr:CpsD/CapB family tyrosine-protein kinase [Myxococcota bacterium]